MADARGRVLIQLAADTRKLRSDLTRVRGQLTGLQKFTKSISSSFIAMFGGFAVLQAFRSGFNSLKGLEFQMSKVAAISGATSKEMVKLRDNAIAVGGASKFTAEEVGKLQEELARLGKTTPEITAMTDSIAALAIVADTELGETAESVAKTINAFQLTAKDTTDVTNIMAESFSKSALNLEKFQVAMANVGAIANVVGFTLAETTALLGVLVDNGIEASKAGTDLRKIFSELNNRGITLNEALKMINESSNKGGKAFDLFGQRAFGAGVILANNTEKIEDLTEAFSDATREMDRMRKLMEDNLETDLKKAGSATDALVQEGSNLLPVIRDLINSFTEFTQVLAGSPASVEARLITATEKLEGFKEEMRSFTLDLGTTNLITGKARVLNSKEWFDLAINIAKTSNKVRELTSDLIKLDEATFLEEGIISMLFGEPRPKGFFEEEKLEKKVSFGFSLESLDLMEKTKKGSQELITLMDKNKDSIATLKITAEDTFSAYGSSVESIREEWANMDGDVIRFIDSQGEIAESIERWVPFISDATKEFRKFADMALITGSIISDLVVGAISGFKSLALAIVGVIQKLLAMAIANAIATESRKGLIGLITASIAVAGFQALISKHVKGFAGGVHNFEGGLAVVGERGPELAHLPQGTNIIPNNKIGNMAGNITINMGLVTDPQGAAREIAEILNRYGNNKSG